jgi:PTH1 family peptidyl-tRNA hydrolase
MLLIVGLGNPGADYQRHRHNVGFVAVDAIHRRHGFPPWRRRFHSEISEGTLAGRKVLLLKPQTYMNESGRAVREAVYFYKIDPKDIVVIHDEVDLPPGKTRMKAGGGTAGHNGLRSIGPAIGEDFRRLRIGVGHPGYKDAVPHYVLHDFPKADHEWLLPLIDAIAEHAPLLAEDKDSTFANRLHGALNPAAAGDKKSSGAASAQVRSTGPERSAAVDERPGATETQREGPLARGLRKLFGR